MSIERVAINPPLANDLFAKPQLPVTKVSSQ